MSASRHHMVLGAAQWWPGGDHITAWRRAGPVRTGAHPPGSWLLLGASAVAAVAVLAIPETALGHSGIRASLRPRVAVPREARGTFTVALPCLIAAWALNGFYLSLGPSLGAQVLHSPDLLWGGLAIFLLRDRSRSHDRVPRRQRP